MPWSSDDNLFSEPLEIVPIKTRQFVLSDVDIQRLVNAKLGDAIPTGRTVAEIVTAVKGLADRTQVLQAVFRRLRDVLELSDATERDKILDSLIAKGTP